MKYSLSLGKVAGIDIFVHWTFLILPAWIGLSSLAAGSGLPGALYSVLFLMAVFGCVVLHELGHALMARRFGIGTRDITLLPIGGVARLDRMPERPSQELAVALAGPAVNVLIAVTLLVGFVLAGVSSPLLFSGVLGGPFLVSLMWANMVLVLFNLLPAFPMDGGRVVRALLATRIPYVRATKIAAGIGQAMAAVFAVVGLFSSWTLLLVALFVYLAARGEAEMVAARSLADGFAVGDVMQRRFFTVPSQTRLADAASAMLFCQQHDFPVVDGLTVVGMLTRRDVLRAMSMGEGHRRVDELMRHDPPTVSEETPLGETMASLSTGEHSSLPVLRFGRLVGMLTAENLRNCLMLSAGSYRRKSLVDHASG